MKKKIIIGFLLMVVSFPYLIGCDFHGTFLGINPNYNQNLIGIMYRYRYMTGMHFHSHGGHTHGPGETEELTGDLLESFHTLELRARWYPTEKVQLWFNLPFSMNTEAVGGVQTERITGVGDLSFMARYQVFNRFPKKEGGWEHRMFAGGGVKLPSGVFRSADRYGGVNPLLQTGTGSLDFLGGLTYLVKVGKWGMSTDLIYRYNTRNWYGYRFANRFNLTSSLFYRIDAGKLNFFPNAGVFIEQSDMNTDREIYQVNTGGSTLLGTGGVDIYLNNLSLNLSVQVPLSENLFGTQGQGGPRLATGINYAF